jgi:hypothetical protein
MNESSKRFYVEKEVKVVTGFITEMNESSKRFYVEKEVKVVTRFTH